VSAGISFFLVEPIGTLAFGQSLRENNFNILVIASKTINALGQLVL